MTAEAVQPDLFSAPIRFDGSDYLPWRDDERLTGQLLRVLNVIIDGAWHQPHELEAKTKDDWASISAQLRHLRKRRFGQHTIEKEYLGDGLYRYRFIENPDAAAIMAAYRRPSRARKSAAIHTGPAGASDMPEVTDSTREGGECLFEGK